MTKEQLEARNLELVRICDKETARADATLDALLALYGAVDAKAWLAIPDQVKASVLAVINA